MKRALRRSWRRRQELNRERRFCRALPRPFAAPVRYQGLSGIAPKNGDLRSYDDYEDYAGFVPDGDNLGTGTPYGRDTLTTSMTVVGFPVVHNQHRGSEILSGCCVRGSLMKRSVCVVISLFALSSGACHSNSTTATTPTPTPTTVSLTGTVTAVDAGAIAGALVKILDGPNVGMSTTTSSAGIYSLTGLTAGNANLSASASTTIYDEVRLGVLIDGTNTLNFVFAVPACKTNNTAMVTFGNRSATATQDIIWDGTQLFVLGLGQTRQRITSAAGVAHTLRFKIDGTATLACADSTPILALCSKNRLITCSAP